MNLNKLPFFRFKIFRIGLGLLGLLLLVYLFVMLRSVIPATVNDRELRLERADIPQGSNAYYVLYEASNHIQLPDKLSQQITDLEHDSNWDDSLAQMVLANNREALAGWDAAAKLPELQVPEIKDVNTLTPNLATWKELALLAGLRENLLMHRGQDKEAFDQMVNGVQLARRMQDSHSVLIGYLVGTAVNSLGLNQIQKWSGKSHLNPSQLKNYIHQLEFDPDEEAAAFANTMRAEYQCDMGTLYGLRKGMFVANSDSDFRLIKLNPLLPVYNGSQTRALFASRFLVWVKAAPLHYNAAEDEIKTKSEKLPGGYDLRPPGPVSMILSGNAAGRIFYYSMLPAVGAALAKKSQADTQLQATRTILALRAYQLTHGKLPSDLNALVPEFLAEVPTDDFDGQPLRYFADRKIVYSVGKNLKDDGGDDSRVQNVGQLDLVYKFDF